MVAEVGIDYAVHRHAQERIAVRAPPWRRLSLVVSWPRRRGSRSRPRLAVARDHARGGVDRTAGGGRHDDAHASQSSRRALSHCSARAIASAETQHVRVRPIFSVEMRPLASRTCTCWTIAASVVSKGAANSLTDAGPCVSRSRTARRVGSESAWKTRSSCGDWSSICFSIVVAANSQAIPLVLCRAPANLPGRANSLTCKQSQCGRDEPLPEPSAFNPRATSYALAW